MTERIFRLPDYDLYDYDGHLMYLEPKFTIHEGITALVGCNGSGKTTLMNLLEEALVKADIPVMKMYGVDDRERIRAKASMMGFSRDGLLEALVDTTFASEGEKMANTVYHKLRDLGTFIFDRKLAHPERWILMDSVDSATSIDNVDDVMDLLERILSEDDMKPEGVQLYFVLAANSYEIARRSDCIYVRDATHRIFDSYDSYREFVLQSRKEKDERYGQVQVQGKRPKVEL